MLVVRTLRNHSEITRICSEISDVYVPVNFRDLTESKRMLSMFKIKVKKPTNVLQL